MTSEVEERPRVVTALYGGLGVNGLSEFVNYLGFLLCIFVILYIYIYIYISVLFGENIPVKFRHLATAINPVWTLCLPE